MKAVARILIAIGVVGVVAVANAQESFTPQRNDPIQLTLDLSGEASEFTLILLMEKGAIPEITANRHPSIRSRGVFRLNSETQFPLNAQTSVVMNDAPGTTYGFVVTKTDRASPWALTKAWKESNGVKTDLALPSADVQNAANVEMQSRRSELRPSVK